MSWTTKRQCSLILIAILSAFLFGANLFYKTVNLRRASSDWFLDSLAELDAHIGADSSNIFFVETDAERTEFEARHLRAFESAAAKNPDKKVRIA